MDEYRILENHVVALYHILGHTNHFSRVGAVDIKSKQFENKIVNGIEEVLSYARTWNGKRNVFISRLPRTSDGSVASCCCVTFDIDPLRDTGAATDEQHNNALTAGRRILEKYPGGYLVSSGNGALLLYRVPNINDYVLHYKREAVFIQQLQEMVKDLNVRIDPTSYAEAIIKMAGTLSTKGDGRYARFLPFPPSLSNIKDSNLLDAINTIEIPKEEINTKKFEGDPVKRIKDAQECILSLSSKRRDSYEDWLKVGMALKEFGIAGLSLWKEWSKPSEKYNEKVCEEKWSSFKDTPEVSIGTLKLWAREDSSILLLPAVPRPRERKISYFDQLFQADSQSGNAITTGIRSLDSCLRQMPKGEIVTFAARSGYGKTSLACTIAESLRYSHKRVLYFSTEIPETYLMHKFVSIVTGIPTQNLIEHKFTEQDRARIGEYQQELLLSPITINDEFKPTLQLVASEIKKHKPDIIIFDHISHIDTNWQNIAEFLKGLKVLTQEADAVTLLLSQLNEPGRNSKGEEMQSIRGDVRGSQEIIFLSAIFAYITNPYEVKTEHQPVEIHISKNRFGLSGAVVPLMVNKATGKFYELETV